MNDILSASLLTELREYLLIHLGLSFSCKSEKELIPKIGIVAKELGYNDTVSFISWLIENNLTDQQLEILASYLTIGETYFLRENQSFDFLEYKYLPRLIRNRKGKDQRLRIWSAGCATGEEPYTIAIMLRRLIQDIENWNISILATDINSKFLEKAKTGIYTQWSFRNNPGWFRDKYFIKKDDNEFEVRPEIKKMVTFMPHNLAKDNYPSLLNSTNAMDIIFCRNVLIYFSRDGIKRAAERFYKSLIRGGIFIVGSVETSHLISSKFNIVNYSGFIIYSKDSKVENGNKIPKYEIQLPKKELENPHPVLSKKRLGNEYPKQKIKSEPKKKVQINSVSEKKTHEAEIPQISNYEQAVVLFNQGLFDEAEKLFLDIKSDEKENRNPVISFLAKTKANLGKLEEAKLLCDEALKVNKTDYSMYYLKATIAYELDDYNETVTSLNRAVYLNHDFVLAHFLLGNLNIKQGKNNAGMKCFQNALKILAKLNPEEILPESDGITVGRLVEVISAIK